MSRLEFRSVRTDGSMGTWHPVRDGGSWLAPSQGWAGITFREVPDDAPEDVSGLPAELSGVERYAAAEDGYNPS